MSVTDGMAIQTHLTRLWGKRYADVLGRYLTINRRWRGHLHMQRFTWCRQLYFRGFRGVNKLLFSKRPDTHIPGVNACVNCTRARAQVLYGSCLMAAYRETFALHWRQFLWVARVGRISSPSLLLAPLKMVNPCLSFRHVECQCCCSDVVVLWAAKY